MEMLKYTLEQVSYAIVEPSYAFILIMLSILFYFKNKKANMMEKMIMGQSSISAFELTISQIVMGIFGGILASIIFTYLGIVFDTSSNIYVLFILSIGLVFLNPKWVCLSYSGSILGLFSILMYILSKMFNNSQLNFLNMDIAALLALIGVMHLVEGFLVMIDGKRGALPVFGNRENKIVGGFAFRRYWILPMTILLMMEATSGNIGGEVVNTPAWWPIISHKKNIELFATMIIGALPLFAAVGYNAVTFTKAKEKKPLFSGMLISGFGLLVIGLSFLASLGIVMEIILLVAVPAAHEGMLYLEKYVEQKNQCKYVSNAEGVCVLNVAPNSVAKEMGIESGDLIIEVNNESLTRDDIIFNVLQNVPRVLSMKIKKIGGKIIEVSKNIPSGTMNLGMVIVPREVPRNFKVIKGNKENFSEMLDKIRNKDDENHNV